MAVKEETKFKIKYVALGDAFSAGYNSKIGFPTNGFLDNNNEINGLCYPSNLATLFKNDNNFELDSFYNFSFLNGSINFLKAIYSSDKKMLKKMSNKLDLIQSVDWFSSNIFKGYFSNFLKDWNINNNDFNFFLKKIKEANLITLSAGFYDFWKNLPFNEIISLHKLRNEVKDEVIKEIKIKIHSLQVSIQNNLIDLINWIKDINRNAKIIITNYPPLLLNLKTVINSFINVDNNEFDIYNFLLESLEKIVKLSAKKTQVDFIDINDADYWNQNKEYLFESIFSIYPTEKGYKKIAFDIYTKLFINDKKLLNDFNNITFKKSYISDKAYWIKEQKDYIPISETTDNIFLFKNIYGNNKNEKIFSPNTTELKLLNNLNSGTKISDFISLFIRYKKFLISDISKKIISNKFKKSEETYDSIEKILDFLNNEQRSKEAILTLLKNQKIDNILYIIEKSLANKYFVDNQSIDFNLIKKETSQIFEKEQNLVYDVLKYFFSSSLIKESKHDIKNIFKLLVNDSLNTTFLTYLFNIKNNKKFKKIKKYLSSLNSFNELLDFFIESLINHSDTYLKLNNFDELWKYFIVKNKYNLLHLFDKMFLELTDDEKIEETVDFFIQTIKSSIRLEFETKDYKNLKNSIKNILIIFKNNPKYLNNIFLKFLDNIKNFSLYNMIFQLKSRTKKAFKISNFISLNIFFISGLKILKNALVIKKIIKKYIV